MLLKRGFGRLPGLPFRAMRHLWFRRKVG